MLHIILLLLKIIGILLLCILGLILLLLLTTLFVPIRYRVAAQHGENLFYLKGRIHWLLHIVHLSVSHIEGQLHIQARLFGFIVYDNHKPKKPKVTKNKEIKKKETKKKVVKNKVVNNKAVKKKTVKNKVASNKVAKRNEDLKECTVRKVDRDTSSSASKLESKLSQDTIIPNATDTVDNMKTVEEKASWISTDTITEREITAVQKEAQTVKTDHINSSEENTASADRVRIERKSFFHKLLERIRSIRDKIVSTFLEWKAKIGRSFSTVSSFRFKLKLILNFLRDEMNKEGMHLTFSSLKRLLKHVLPTKLKSKLTFGTGDPCSTGQALGAMSILYSFYGERIQITPDFERSILEGEHFARGRIRLVTILIIIVKLIFDKRFKQLKNNFIILKEAL